MPPPVVVCSICGETVSKRQTQSIGPNKRACTKHEQTESAALVAQVQLADEQKRRRQKEKERWQRKDPFEAEIKVRKPSCMNCNTTGILQREYYLEVLVLCEQWELKTGRYPTFLEPDIFYEATKSLRGKRCLWYVPLEKYPTILNEKLPPFIIPIVHLLRVALLCPVCAKDFGIDLNDLSPIKDITFDQIMNFSTMTEVYVKPVLREVAHTRIVAEAKGSG
jgi:hypothetical protein